MRVGKNMPLSMIQPVAGAPEKAFASGVRSTILKMDNQWYRLKGTGVNDEGIRAEFVRVLCCGVLC